MTRLAMLIASDAAISNAGTRPIGALELEDQDKRQTFSKPGFILWELVNGNMKWRLRFDQRPDEGKRRLIDSGGSRFCAGTHFGEVENPDQRRHLGYGGPTQFLRAQAKKLAEVDDDGNYTIECIKIKKIFIVAIMVDMIEEWFPESTQSPENIMWFKQKSGLNSDFMKAWHVGLNDALDEQRISLEELMSAEMKRERLKSDKIARWAEILRKPEGSITADELEFIKQRIAEKQANVNPGSSSSGAKPSKGSQVGNDADKRGPKAPKETPSDYPPMPRRPTPPTDSFNPPGKRRKGDPKGAAERAPSGSKGAQQGSANRAGSAPSSGKGKGKWKGEEKGKNKGERLRTPSARPNERTQPMRDHLAHLPPPPVALVEREDGVVIKRNPYTDVRVADRQRRENAVPLQRGAPRYDPPDEAYPRNGPNNAYYRDWHENAWVGHHPDPPAENRHYGENDGNWCPRENVRGRDGTWYPRVEDRGRDGTWHSTPYPSNLQPRLRSRTPGTGKGKGKGDGSGTRVYVHGGYAEWEVVDHEDDEFWDRQNERSQFRRNMEYRRAN